MLFDITHTLYMVISAILTAGLLVLCAVFVKKQEHKIFIVKLFAVVTVILHYSNIWVEYFGNAGSTAGLEDNHLLPIYPCNVMMWLLLIASFLKNKSGTVFTLLAEFCFWGGVVCGSVGIIANQNYANTPSLLDWDILKGLLSHSTMLFGCIYLLVGKFIKIRIFNVVSVEAGLACFIIDGLFVNWLFAVCQLPEVNAMYLLHSPFPEMPWINPILIGLIVLALLFIGLAFYELSFPLEERWYTKLKTNKELLLHNLRGN